MADMPRISESEWIVMEVLWSKGALATNEIIAALSESKTWGPKTIKTFLFRLVHKGVLQPIGPRSDRRYLPVFTRDTCLQAENQSFLDRLYGGSAKPLLANFLRSERLSAEDIAELKALLDGR